MQTELRSNGAVVVVVKFWGALIWGGGGLAIFGEDFRTWRFVFVLPFLLLAAFHLSLAIVEVRDQMIRYRRFFKWTEIQCAEVIRAGRVWPPFIGYIKLQRFVFPWGRVYFVLDKNTETNPIERGSFPLLRYLNKHAPQNQVQSSAAIPWYRSSEFGLLVAGSAGIIACLLFFYLNPTDISQTSLAKPSATMPSVLRLSFYLAESLREPVVQVCGFAAMVCLTILRRDQREAWVYAFLSGFVVTGIAARLLT
jgi:hypothetical protein